MGDGFINHGDAEFSFINTVPYLFPKQNFKIRNLTCNVTFICVISYQCFISSNRETAILSP